MYHIIWPKNPDTDWTCATIVAAEYFRLLGEESTPYWLSELNEETKNILQHLGIESPELLTTLPSKSDIVMVGHNDFAKSISNIESLTIKSIIDCHPVTWLTLLRPVQLRFEPVCSTCSILFLMFVEQDLDIDDILAKLILAGILSATRSLESAETTDEEREIVQYLADDLGVGDIKSYAKMLFWKN